jgi:RNA polymerase sigma factor for flagellar operon FliA
VTHSPVLSEEEIESLVHQNHGWAESIARSVARAWNMDWQLDGLDGAAMEALLFCVRRFDPSRGVPFRAYARKRIHEASSDAARKTHSWQRGMAGTQADGRAREISAELLNVFPELRSGELPIFEEGGEDDLRGSIRNLLMGANIIAARMDGSEKSAEEAMDTKRTVEVMANLDLVHQLLLWRVYWEGLSMRGVADDWGTDELNIIREHKALLTFLHKSISRGKVSQVPKVRPGLKTISLKVKREGQKAPFSQLLRGATP